MSTSYWYNTHRNQPPTLHIEHEDGSTEEKVLPSKWAICPTCDGDGKHSHALGAFTREDMDYEGPDFMEDYMNGAYDQTCDVCNGSGKIRVLDENACSKEDLEAYTKWERDEAEFQAICRSERMMGA